MSSMTPTMTTSTSKNNGHHPCGCSDSTPSQACCCNLVCFDKPNYFCGHLLTDGDLTLQQKYVVEKNKLYHRTMDGYGIVCGLKLTCDCDCKGHIWIHDGFAIDDCGNDLVVCEATRFDVIGALKAKGLLFTDPPEEECEGHERRKRCEVKQCFYVTICYEETESNFETPFQSTCTSGPKQCLPTRVHEGVRFDVTDKLPPRQHYLDELEEKFRCCFELFCDGPISGIMREKHRILRSVIIEGKVNRDDWHEACQVFCQLRAYFLNHLRIKCDQFNCDIEKEVLCLRCPEWGPNDPKIAELQEVFRKLVTLMAQYQFDCALGELVFNCQQPCEAHCLVLGTVEVLDGKLIRVCNAPRRYLWAPANLIPVLFYTVYNDMFGGRKDRHCCPDFDKFMPEQFLQLFELDSCALSKTALAGVEAMRAVQEALHRCFDFTDTALFASSVLRDVDREKIEGLGVTPLPRRPVSDLQSFNPLQALYAAMPLRTGGYAVQYEKNTKVERVLPEFFDLVSPDKQISKVLETALAHKSAQVDTLNARIEELSARLAALEDQGKKGKKKSDDRAEQ